MESKVKVMKVANGLHILYAILFALSIVSAILCLLFGLMFTAFEAVGLFEDTAILEMLGSFEDLGYAFDFGAFDMFMYGAAVSFFGFAILYGFAKKFYKRVLAVGDPFDRGVICKMQTLGILHLVIPFVFEVISGFFFDDFMEMETGRYSTFSTPAVALGVVYILLTFVFSYAADLKEGKNGTAPEEEKKTLPEE